MDKNLQKDFVVQHGQALSCLVDVNNCNPAKLSSAATVQDYVIQLCKMLGIERNDDCMIVHHCGGTQDFMSFIQVVDHGLITGHVCLQGTSIFTDVFINRVFDPVAVTQFTQSFFDGGRKSVASKIRR